MKGKENPRWLMKDPSRERPSAAAAGPSNAVASSSSSSRVKVEDTTPGWLRRSMAQGSARPSGGEGGPGGVRVKKELMDWEEDGEGVGRGRRDDNVRPFQSRSSVHTALHVITLMRSASLQVAEGDADADFEDAFSDDDGLIEFDQADEAENKELEVGLLSLTGSWLLSSR